MDVWLKWLTGKISTGKFKYWLGTAIYMKIPFCIKSIPNNIYSWKYKKSSNKNERNFG